MRDHRPQVPDSFSREALSLLLLHLLLLRLLRLRRLELRVGDRKQRKVRRRSRRRRRLGGGGEKFGGETPYVSSRASPFLRFFSPSPAAAPVTEIIGSSLRI